jgi:N-acetylneuraminic acid mutarotase
MKRKSKSNFSKKQNQVEKFFSIKQGEGMSKFFTILSLAAIAFAAPQSNLNFEVNNNLLDPDKPPAGLLMTTQELRPINPNEIDIAIWDTLRTPYPISSIFCGMNCVDDSGYLYGIGGQSPVTESVYRYNMRTNTWTALPPMPRANVNQTAVWWTDTDGSATDSSGIFVLGRYNTGTFKTCNRWCRANNTWDTIAQYPGDAYTGNMAVVIGDTIYMIHRKGLGAFTEFHKYAIRTGTWVAGETPADTENYYGAICSYGGGLWQLGGWIERQTFQCYRPGLGWTLLASSTTDVGGNRGMIAGYGGKIFAWGGGKGWNAKSGMAVYDTATNIWSPEPNIPKPCLGAFYGAIPDSLGSMGLHMVSGYPTSGSRDIHARGEWNPIVQHDVGCSKIELPADTAFLWERIIPACSVYNYGENTENYLVRMKIDGFYEDTVSVIGHQPHTSKQITFSSCLVSKVGAHIVSCSTELFLDMNNANDRKSGTIMVNPPLTYWSAMEPIPTSISGKNPRQGSCMTGIESTGKVYFLKASKTPEFFVFTPPTDSGAGTWLEAEPMPLGVRPDDGRNPSRGAAMTAYENSIYILRGNRTPGFWEYSTISDSNRWYKRANIPAGVRNPKYGSGVVAVTIGDTDYIFAMKGSNTTEFYLYNIFTNGWSSIVNPPTGASRRIGYKKGSCLCYDGDQYVYVLKGKYGDFFRYNLLNNSWEELVRYDPSVYLNRDGKKRTPQYGASLAYYNGNVYMLKGGNTNEVWKYDVTGDNWSQMDPGWDIPAGCGRRVQDGGTMILFDNFFYVAKGFNTPEFYRLYPASLKTQKSSKPATENIMSKNCIIEDVELTVYPNPAIGVLKLSYNQRKTNLFSIKLYNINGELVKSYTNLTTTRSGIITIDVKTLASGVYILRFITKDITLNQKLVIKK